MQALKAIQLKAICCCLGAIAAFSMAAKAQGGLMGNQVDPRFRQEWSGLYINNSPQSQSNLRPTTAFIYQWHADNLWWFSKGIDLRYLSNGEPNRATEVGRFGDTLRRRMVSYNPQGQKVQEAYQIHNGRQWRDSAIINYNYHSNGQPSSVEKFVYFSDFLSAPQRTISWYNTSGWLKYTEIHDLINRNWVPVALDTFRYTPGGLEIVKSSFYFISGLRRLNFHQYKQVTYHPNSALISSITTFRDRFGWPEKVQFDSLIYNDAFQATTIFQSLFYDGAPSEHYRYYNIQYHNYLPGNPIGSTIASISEEKYINGQWVPQQRQRFEYLANGLVNHYQDRYESGDYILHKRLFYGFDSLGNSTGIYNERWNFASRKWEIDRDQQSIILQNTYNQDRQLTQVIHYHTDNNAFPQKVLLTEYMNFVPVSNLSNSIVAQVEANIFPNPATEGQISIHFPQPIEKAIALKLYNIQGTALQTIELGAGTTGYQLQYDAQNLPSGMYFIKLQDLSTQTPLATTQPLKVLVR